jgi:hypothetical protein
MVEDEHHEKSLHYIYRDRERGSIALKDIVGIR